MRKLGGGYECGSGSGTGAEVGDGRLPVVGLSASQVVASTRRPASLYVESEVPAVEIDFLFIRSEEIEQQRENQKLGCFLWSSRTYLRTSRTVFESKVL